MPHDIEALFPAVVARLTGGEYRAASNGLTFRCPVAERHKHGDRNPSCRLYVGRGGALMGKCLGCGAGFAELSRVAGLPAADWFPEHQRLKGGGTRLKVVARYHYFEADGTPFGVKTRFEPKSFGWSRPLPADLRALCGIRDGWPAVVEGRGAMEQGWFSNTLGQDGVYRFKACDKDDPLAVLIPAAPPPPLFRLPELLAADPLRGVAVCEGEKDVLALTRLGIVATCPPHGANLWRPEYADHFAGRSVLLCPHHDAAGAKLMQQAAGSLLASAAKEIRVLPPEATGSGPGEDVADWIKRQGQCGNSALRQRFRDLVWALPKWVRG